jgi:hypothetical protein
MSKQFLYLTQTAGELPENYQDIPGPESDLIYLTYKEKRKNAIFRPNTTWTEGRNIILAHARTLPSSYEYYIFLDDDVKFLIGDWRKFEGLLKRYRPAIGVPLWWDLFGDCSLPVRTIYSFDAVVNAFHRDLVDDEIVLPYYDGFDGVSWHYSQLCVIHLSSMLYPDHVLLFNEVKITNTKHRLHPRNKEFAPVEEWFRREVFKDGSFVQQRFRSHPSVLFKEEHRAPFPPLPSYRLDRAQLDRLINVGAPFWRRHREILDAAVISRRVTLVKETRVSNA